MQARRIAIWLGGIALLGATAIDTVAVIGRHLGMPLSGSIELMQAAILISSAVGLVIATLEQTHARVRVGIDRLGGTAREWADRLSDLLTLLFFACLLAGSLWLASDLWGEHEQSELLGISWQALRLVANIALAIACAVLAVRLVRRKP